MKNKNTQKGFSTFIVLILFIVLAGSGLYLYTEKTSKEMPEINLVSTTSNSKTHTTISSKKKAPAVCAMDTKLCPNGTYVSRTGFNCEFACSQVEEKASGIIKSIYSKNNKNYLDIDYIDWNTDWKPGGMNGVVYKNENSKIRTFEINDTVEILFKSMADIPLGLDRDIKNKNIYEQKTLNDLISVLNDKNYLILNPWDIVIVNGVITNITEHYVP